MISALKGCIMELKKQMMHKKKTPKKQIEETCSNYTFQNESDIVDVWEVAGTKENTEWDAVKQILAYLGM